MRERSYEIHRHCFILAMLLVVASAMAGCNRAPSSPKEPGFYDATATSGVDFTHTDGHSGGYYLVETVTGGVALFDYDNDRDLDIYFLNGASLPGRQYEQPPRNALYQNEGDFRFQEVTTEAQVGDEGFSLGCAAADYNNDGHTDLYVSNFRGDTLYRNNGDGTFSDVTQQAGIQDDRLGAGVCFVDLNQDGWLDLYAANYIRCSLDDPPECSRTGVPLYCDPSTYDDVYTPERDRIYLNNGDGTFRNAGNDYELPDTQGRGMGIVSFDYNQDTTPDIFVANDVTENFLFKNVAKGGLEEVGLFAGVAYDRFGRRQGSMGCDAGDYNGDGALDIVVTSYQDQVNTLYKNRGDGTFEDVSVPSEFAKGSRPKVGWACFFFDFDNDADKDVFVANGHLQDRIEDLQPSLSYKQPNQLYQNQGDGTFNDISEKAGPGLTVTQSTRGGAFGDLDNDGDLDLVLSNSREQPTLLRNYRPKTNHWITLKLEGSQSNRSAIGATVRVTTAASTQVDQVMAGNSYQSHSDLRLHFGLGESSQVKQIKIRWPSGQEERFSDLAVDQFLRIREGEGIY